MGATRDTQCGGNGSDGHPVQLLKIDRSCGAEGDFAEPEALQPK